MISPHPHGRQKHRQAFANIMIYNPICQIQDGKSVTMRRKHITLQH